MKILSKEYDVANDRLKDLALMFLEQEKRMRLYIEAFKEVKDETEQGILLIECAKIMDEFTDRMRKMEDG